MQPGAEAGRRVSRGGSSDTAPTASGGSEGCLEPPSLSSLAPLPECGQSQTKPWHIIDGGWIPASPRPWWRVPGEGLGSPAVVCVAVGPGVGIGGRGLADFIRLISGCETFGDVPTSPGLTLCAERRSHKGGSPLRTGGVV